MRDVIGRRERHDLAIRYLCSVHKAGVPAVTNVTQFPNSEILL